MKRMSIPALVAMILIYGGPSGLCQEIAGKSPGIVVEAVGKGSAGEKAGIRPGDILTSWERAATPPANPQAARGPLTTPFDLAELEMEQAPRGEVTLSGLRPAGPFKAVLQPGDWGILSRPPFGEEFLAAYRDGKRSMDAKEVERGLALWKEAAEKLKNIHEPLQACCLLFMAGDVLAGARKWEGAQAAYGQAIGLSGEAGRPDVSARIWNARGVAYKKQNDLSKALEACGESLNIRKGISRESLGTAAVLHNLGVLNWTRRDLKEAEGYYRESLEIREKLAPGSLCVAASLNNLGVVAGAHGDLAGAEEYQKRSLAIREKLSPEGLDTAASLNSLGKLANSRGDLAGAEGYWKRALAIREKLAPESLDAAGTLNNLGVVARTLGDLAGAEAYFRRALAIDEKHAPGSLDVVASLVNLGSLASSRGDLAGAEAYYRRSLSISEKLAPESLDTATSLSCLGSLASSRGDLAGAEESYKRALAIREKLAPESLDTAKSLDNLGSLADSCGDLAGAEESYKRALAIREKLAPGSLSVAGSLTSLGIVSRARGDLAGAEDNFKRALAIREKLAPESLSVATSLHNLGCVAADRGDLAGAEELCRKALAIKEKLAPGSLGAAASLHNLGYVSMARGDLAGAEEHYQKALAIRESLVPGSASLAHSLYNLGVLFKMRKDPRSALPLLQKAAQALESQKGKLGGGEEAQEIFSARYADFYRDLVDVQTLLDKNDDAFQTLERFRARSLLDMLAERDLNFARDAPEALIREQKRVNFEYDKVQQQLGEINPEKEAEKTGPLVSKLRELMARQREIGEKIRAASPKLASLQYPEPLDVKGASGVLEPGTLLLSYCVGKTSIHLFALLDGRLSVHPIPGNRQELAESIALYRSLLTDPNSGGDGIPQMGRKLYDRLVKPAGKEIRRARSLLICPDGPLHLLPFSALMDGRRHYLIEEKPIAYALSATVHAETRKPKSTGAGPLALAAFGDPVYPGEEHGGTLDGAVRYAARLCDLTPLPSTRAEVEAIGQLFKGTRAYLGENAREERVKQLEPTIPLIHFACHGILDESLPLNSGLALTIPLKMDEGRENGLLQAWEVFEQLRLDADLVTLSACGTGLGKEMGGEGLIGLTRAFQYAGARSVLSTLWSVADERTAEFMNVFYGHIKAGKSKAEALRRAQTAFIRGTGWKRDSPPGTDGGGSARSGRRPRADSEGNASHPFYWAAFVLHGH
ncbi:MAG: tetratricopeptide repeat protein [Acidobacteria bacterium]|nr:tetratricopeptide repeat protein [Acidobacteriota bacterium]